MRKTILIITFLIVILFVALTSFFDQISNAQISEKTAYRTLEDSTALLLEMRKVYRERIFHAHLPLTTETIRLCPGSVLSEMAHNYEESTQGKFKFGNVTDNPRNPKNLADDYGMQAMIHFGKHPNETRHFQKILLPDGSTNFQMSTPLWTEKQCLTCHGPRESTLPVVQNNYTTGFGYHEGELRGILYTRINISQVSNSDLATTRLIGITITALCIFGLLLISFNQFVLKRLKSLADAVQNCGDGQFDPLPFSPQNDEMDQVIDKYNNMVQALNQRETTLEYNSRVMLHQKQFLNTVLDNLHDPVAVISTEFEIVVSNRSMRDRYHERMQEHGINYCYKVLHDQGAPCTPDQRRCPLREILQHGHECCLTHVTQGCQGKPVLLDIAASPLRDLHGRITGIVESLHDVTSIIQNETELRFSQEELVHQAHSDPLTGLPNRRDFEETLEAAINQANLDGSTVGLAFLDLDGFKDINDALGHPIGDELLCHTARTLRHCVRQSDFVGRLAGDEFVVIIRHLDKISILERIANHIIEKCRLPVQLAGQSTIVTASVGLACYPGDAQNAQELLKLADIAMYSAKKAGRNCYRFFVPEMGTAVSNRFALANDLQQAIEQQEFFLVYQPQYESSGEKLRGVEALMRWRSPTRGLVPPDQFIPLLEESGLIQRVGIWLLDESLGQLRQWLDAGMAELVMSINVSASEFNAPDFVTRIATGLQQHGIAPHLLELEVTERMALLDIDKMIQVLEQLNLLGVRTALDDFGTGYSSLSYLTRLPINTLKIDRSFVKTLPGSEKSQGVVQLIAGLGHMMGMEIIAEGVERTEELEHIRNAGCEVIQGYLFGKPQSAEEISKLTH